MGMWKRIFLVAIMFSALAFAVAEEPEGLKIGVAAPPLTLKNLDGKMVYLSNFCGPECDADKRKPVVVHFFGVHCKPCEIEIPAFQRLLNDQLGKKAVIVFVDVYEPIEDVLACKNRFNLGAIILHDRHGEAARDWKILDEKGFIVLPWTFLLDKEGVLRLSLKGAHQDIDTLILNELKSIGL